MKKCPACKELISSLPHVHFMYVSFFQRSFCSEVSEELRFTVRCFGGAKKSIRQSPSKDVVDNGIRFTNIPGFADDKTKAIYT